MVLIYSSFSHDCYFVVIIFCIFFGCCVKYNNNMCIFALPFIN